MSILQIMTPMIWMSSFLSFSLEEGEGEGEEDEDEGEGGKEDESISFQEFNSEVKEALSLPQVCTAYHEKRGNRRKRGRMETGIRNRGFIESEGERGSN